MESKSKILYLYKLLNELTDENHPLSTVQIIAEMKSRGVDIARKAVAANISLLEEIGVDIITVRSSQNLFYIGSRRFELAEVKLLVDAVESSKLITTKKSKRLVEKLATLVSVHQADELNRQLFIDKRVKPTNEEIYYTIDKIHTAINSKKNITFKYIDYTADKEITYKHNGQIYEVSPYALAWNDDHYYMIGYSSNYDEIRTFRVDRMAKTEVIDTNSVLAPVDFNAAEYVKNIFYMYDGKTETVELKCTNDLMKVIIDKFGEDVKTQTLGSNCFKVFAPVSVSPTFYGWVFQFAGKMSIIAPPLVKENYKKMAELVQDS
ncbi:MAG: WYL domain-containing protein [Clostridia bacterium]|nr:WYL domain-containing protein [Clostridia bacterium]